MLCEAGELNDAELEFLHRRGWETLRGPNGELLVGCRTNGQGSQMTMLAGPTLVGVAHSHLPLTYMIVDIKFGKTLPHGSQGSQPSLSSSLCLSLELQHRERPGQPSTRGLSLDVHRLPVLSGGPHWGRPRHGALPVLWYQAGVDGHPRRDVSECPHVLFGCLEAVSAVYAVLHPASTALQCKQPPAPETVRGRAGPAVQRLSEDRLEYFSWSGSDGCHCFGVGPFTYRRSVGSSPRGPQGVQAECL